MKYSLNFNIGNTLDLNIEEKWGIQRFHGVIGNPPYVRQELFKEIELSGYIDSNLISSTKSPFDFVIYDSNTESAWSNKQPRIHCK